MFAFLLLAAVVGSEGENPDNVVRCVRESVTGTLSGTRRVCHTVGEWRRIRRDSKAEADRLITESMEKPPSN